MSRPRRPGDPVRWPVPCGRCNQHHEIVVYWPDTGVCGYCYQQAKRSRGRCDCGHEVYSRGELTVVLRADGAPV